MTTREWAAIVNIYTCGDCGVVYGIEAGFNNERRADGRTFYCPNGHRLAYKETDLTRAEKAAARAQELLNAERRGHEDTRNQLVTTELRRRAEVGVKTKLQRRIAVGICPCCHRTVKQLAAHMKSKHPEFAK